MPNYNLIISTDNFKPFDYSLALNAIRDYNAGYEKSLAVYDKISQTLGDLASAVKGSTRAKDLYDEYLNRFNAAADEFSRGMNIRTARELGALRKLYGTLIRQLEKANEARVKAAEYLRAKNKDDTYMHESLGTLDDWVDNPTRDIRGYSGTLLTGEVSALSKAVGQSIASILDNGRLDPYVKLYKQFNGFRTEDVDKTIVEVLQGGINSVTNPIMRGILQNAMNSSGIYKWADEATREQAELTAARGLYGGIGQTKVSTYDDKYANADLQLQKQLALEELKRQWAKEDAAEAAKRTTSAVINPSNIYSAENAASLVSNVRNYGKYFTTETGGDGITRTRLNKEGIKAYNTKVQTISGKPTTTPEGTTILTEGKAEYVDSPFKKFVDEQLGGTDYMNKRQYGNLGNKWNQYKAQDFLKYDATGLTEYNYNIDPSEYKNWKDRIAERADGYLYRVTWDSKKKQWVSNDNDRVSISDVYANSEPVSTQSSIYGRTFKMVDKDGNTVRYRLPRGINARAEQNIDLQLRGLDVVQSIYKKMSDLKATHIILTIPEAKELNNITGSRNYQAGQVINIGTLLRIHSEFEDNLAIFESQLGITNTNKPLEWNPINYGGN